MLDLSHVSTPGGTTTEPPQQGTGLNWRLPAPTFARLAKSVSYFSGFSSDEKSARTSNCSDSGRHTGRKDNRPLHQVAEVLSLQSEALAQLMNEASAALELRECLNELIATEANYVTDLKEVTHVFVEPLRAVLPANKLYAIFSNLVQLKELHIGFHQDLVKAQKEIDNDYGLSAVTAFAKMMPYFKMYTAYCSNYPNVASALSGAREEFADAATLLDQAESSHGVSLQALLFRPVQRLCIYPLLLQKMSRSSAEGSEVREKCELVFHSMQELNVEVNETIRRVEANLRTMTALMSVENMECLVEAGRQLHVEVNVDMKCPTANALSSWGKRRSYKWYILSDYLLICKPRKGGDTFVKRALWPLADLLVAPANVSFIGMRLKWKDGRVEEGSTSSFGAVSHSSGSTSHTESWRRVTKSSVSGRSEGTSVDQPQDSLRSGEHPVYTTQHRGGKPDKPEVFRLCFEGVEYKCWANSQAEMLTLVDQLSNFITSHQHMREDIQKRVAATAG